MLARLCCTTRNSAVSVSLGSVQDSREFPALRVSRYAPRTPPRTTILRNADRFHLSGVVDTDAARRANRQPERAKRVGEFADVPRELSVGDAAAIVDDGDGDSGGGDMDGDGDTDGDTDGDSDTEGDARDRTLRPLVCR